MCITCSINNIVMFLIFLSIVDVTTSTNMTETLRRVRRIVGGEPTEISHVPYLVNIRKKGKMHCGGSLITPRCVISAAHCVNQGQPADFIIRAGVTYLQEDINSRRVQRIFIPQDYTPRSLNRDVAIFQLADQLNGANMEYIKLSNIELELGDTVTVSGWGLTSETAKNPSNQMHSVDVRVLSQTVCRELYRNYRNVTNFMFCASIPGSKDACMADSGGPVVYNGELVGIVSWGRYRECGRIESPGVYVKVKALQLWIENVITKHCL